MPTAIPNLWPEEVTNVNVISPVAILKFQASELRKQTHNLLDAEVESIVEGTTMKHRFAVVAPALNRYRFILFSVWHRDQQVYPCMIDAKCFEGDYGGVPEASTQDEFIKLVGSVFKSSETKAVIHSLIAQSNEAKAPRP